MTSFLLKMHTELKRFFREKINILIFLVIIGILLNHWYFVKIKNKIDHRYFNNVTTQEQIFDVKINTHNGDLKPINHKFRNINL